MDDLFELIEYIWFHYCRIFRRVPPPPAPTLGPQRQPFPLADLPLIPLLMVIQNMDIRTILSLSAQSTKFKNIAKLHTRKMETRYYSPGRFYTCDAYRFRSHTFDVRERYYIGDVEIISKYVGGNSHWWDLVWNKPQKLLRVNGCPFYFEERHGSLRICHDRSWRCPEDAFPRAISDFLLEMFKGNEFEAFLSIDKQQFPPLLFLDQPLRKVCLVSSNDDLLVAPKLLKRALEDLTITEEFFVELKISEKFKYTKGLKYPKMTIRDAHWLTLESILHMKCVHLTVDRARLTDEDVNKLIKTLIDGGLDGVQRIIIDCLFVPYWSEDVMLEGIEWERFRNWSSVAFTKSYMVHVKMTDKNGRRIAVAYSILDIEIVVVDDDSVQW